MKNKGFTRHKILNNCPDCYTVADFAKDNPNGKYIVATISHVIAVVDGNYYDTWDSYLFFTGERRMKYEYGI